VKEKMSEDRYTTIFRFELKSFFFLQFNPYLYYCKSTEVLSFWAVETSGTCNPPAEVSAKRLACKTFNIPDLTNQIIFPNSRHNSISVRLIRFYRPIILLALNFLPADHHEVWMAANTKVYWSVETTAS
jgi:hypothetical protein